ncbi:MULTISPECIES: molybdopterin cofactor-binding domain-containing protein [unclassified Blastococcus]
MTGVDDRPAAAVGAPGELRVVGRRQRPARWAERTAGTDAYTGDVPVDGALTARVLRSPHPHARILRLDVTRAARMPGVRAVVTAADLPGRRYLHEGGARADRLPLADGVVRYVGEEVAAVAADTAEQAEAALRAIRVRYRRLPAPLDVDAALRPGAPRLHDRAEGSNVSVDDRGSWGDPDAGDRATDVTVTGTWSHPRVTHTALETHGTVARWSAAEQRLEVWTSTHAPWFVRRELAEVLGLREEQVVCRDVAVGGGFGAKGKIGEHEALAAALAVRAGRPVRLLLSREEEFAATKPRHAFRTTLRAGADRAGRITVLDADITADNGAYNHFGPSVLKVGVKTLGTLYRPDGVRWRARLVDTALPPGGQFRGYGSPQVALALETAVDELAERLGVDPLELRLRNANEPGTTTLSGARLGSARLRECLEVVRAELDWDARHGALGPGRGLGVAAGMHGSGSYAFEGANRSAATVDLSRDRRVRVRFGGLDPGTGQRGVLAQIAAEELGVPLEAVDVLMADGELTPPDHGAWSSRGTHMGGHAVACAARAARVRLAAAGGWDALPAEGLSVTEEYLDPRMERFGAGNPRPNVSASYTFAAHGAEVAVDRRTGEVRVVDYVAAHDVGRAINPTTAEGQVVGGVVQALGAALREELLHEGGRVVNPAFVHYGVPRAADVPRVRPVLVEGPEPAGPYDAKSVGELPVIPVAPAVLNAVHDATGVRFRSLPLTPDVVLRGIAPDRVAAWEGLVPRTPTAWWVAAVRRAYPLGLHALLDRVGTRLARRRRPRALRRVEQPAGTAELVAAAAGRRAVVVGGATDVTVQRRQGLAAPEVLVRAGAVAALRRVHRDDEHVEVGAAVTLEECAEAFAADLPELSALVRTIASPQLRRTATVAGNLLQEKRCWFFRNGFDCYKRGGPTCPCYAVQGDHRFSHAVLGAHRCQAVTPSDLATVLTALDAQVRVAGPRGERTLPVGELYRGPGETVLGPADVVLAVRLGRAALGRRLVTEKLALWEGDFAVASVALSWTPTATGAADVRVVLGGVAPTPWRARRTEAALEGTEPTVAGVVDRLRDELRAVAHPLPRNAWKLEATMGLAERAAERAVAATP